MLLRAILILLLLFGLFFTLFRLVDRHALSAAEIRRFGRTVLVACGALWLAGIAFYLLLNLDHLI